MGRPSSTSHVAASLQATPQRAGALGARAVVETGLGFDFVASALMLADPAGRKRFTENDLWRRHARAMDSADVRTLERLGAHPMINLVGLASESPGERGPADVLAHLSAVPPAELVLNAVGRYRRTILRGIAGDVIEDAVAGDAAARKQFHDLSWPDLPEWQASLRFLLGRPPEEVAPAIVGALERWHERAFAQEAERLSDAQERAATALRAESTSWRVDTLMRRVTPPVEYVPPAGVEVTTFVPVSSVRPAFVFLDHRMESIVLFPIAEAPASAEEPPELLVLLGKALGDELRLRALRALASGPRTLADLATELGVPRTSLAHHMSILRAAGLVSHTIDDGRWGKLALRADAITNVAPLFRGFMAGASRDGKAGRTS